MTQAPTIFEFVISDPAKNLKPGKSLQIRSRCMQGKNKREGSRRTRREKRKTLEERGIPTEPPKTQLLVASIATSPIIPIDRFAPLYLHKGKFSQEAEMLLSKAFLYNIMDQTKTPLDRCVDIDCLESSSFGFLYSDTLFLNSVLCASYASVDSLNPYLDGRPSHKTLYHLRETLSLLQARMQDQGVHRDESVFQTVFNLTLLAEVSGDWTAVGAHFEGLHKLVHLRGGSAFLRSRPMLHFKLDRIDLAWFLSCGEKPFFTQSFKSWEPIVTLPPWMSVPDRLQPPPHWDFRLANVFQDFQNISVRVNYNRLKYVIHNPEFFQVELSPLQSKLIQLGGELKNPDEQVVRLGLLAFLTSTFKGSVRMIQYKWALEDLGRKYKELFGGSVHFDLSLRLWVLLVVACTIGGVAEPWVRDAWIELPTGLSWVEIKQHLMRVVWFDVLHDKRARLVYEQLERLRYTTSLQATSDQQLSNRTCHYVDWEINI